MLPQTPLAQRFLQGSPDTLALNKFGLGGSKLGPEPKRLIGEFHDLFEKLAGITPGGPSVPLDKVDEAWQKAVKIMGFDPMNWLW